MNAIRGARAPAAAGPAGGPGAGPAAGAAAGPAARPAGARPLLPAGLPVVLDPGVRRLAGGRVLLGGDPGRLVRLSERGPAVLERLARDGADTPAVQALARTLVDGGLAHPRPRPAGELDVTVVVPVRDRSSALDRCLASLGRDVPVLVVDDGSADPARVAEVCRARGARVLHLPVNAGPAAARNAGVAATASVLVAFVDSDCVLPPGWLAALAGHLADPVVVAVAPRVRSRGGRRLLDRYAQARGPLDLGPQEAQVRPGSRVPYVPTAVLLVRRDALGGGFDPALRFGEDVDLVWRLHDAGRQVRYDPRTVVVHEEPGSWWGWLRRRHAYGTSAAPLAQRHGARLTPLVLPPWPTAAWALLLLRRPGLALLAAAPPAVTLHRALRRTGLPAADCAAVALRVTAQGVVATAAGLGGAGAVVALPVLVALLGPRRTRTAAAAALLVPPLLEHAGRRPAVDVVRWCALRLVDDLAYASGVWRSCLSLRAVTALLPRTSRPR